MATRDLVVGGTTITAGSDLTSAQLASLKTLPALLNKGWIYASPDPYYRRTEDGTPQPTYVNPGSYRAMVAALVESESAPAPAPSTPEE